MLQLYRIGEHGESEGRIVERFVSLLIAPAFDSVGMILGADFDKNGVYGGSVFDSEGAAGHEDSCFGIDSLIEKEKARRRG